MRPSEQPLMTKRYRGIDKNPLDEKEKKYRAELAHRLTLALDHPDTVEEYMDHDIAWMDQLRVVTGVHFDTEIFPRTEICQPVTITPHCYTPHDYVAYDSKGIYSSVVALPTYREYQGTIGKEPVADGYMMLIKASVVADGEKAPDPTFADFAWDDNYAMGALVAGDNIRFVELTHSDPAEAGSPYPTVAEIDPSSKDAEQIMMELEKFVVAQEAAMKPKSRLALLGRRVMQMFGLTK